MLRRAPTSVDLIDGGSVRALRAATLASRETLDEQRVAAWTRAIEKQERRQAEIASKYQHLKRAKAATEVAAVGENTEDAADSAPPATKRHKCESSSDVASASAFDSAPCAPPPPLLPAASSFHLAMTAFPLSAAVLAAHTPAHPTIVVTPVQHPLDEPLKMPRTHVALDLHTTISYPRREQKRMSVEEMERVRYRTS
jgi:hypothetical protein